MNIVFAYITPFHPQKGGVGRATHNLTCELIKRGHRVFYLIYVSGITIKHEFDYPAPLAYLPSEELMSKENLEFYHKFLLDNKIDIVVNQSGNFSDSQLWLNTGQSKAKKISVLHTYPSTSLRYLWECDIFPLRNNTLIEKAKRLARMILYPKIKRERYRRLQQEFEAFLPQTDVTVALTKNILPELNSVCGGFEEKYVFIPNSNSYSNEDLRLMPKKKKQVLFVGLFGTLKREDLMAKIWLKVCGKFPDWELIIVGYGDEGRTKRLESIASRSKSIKLVGYKNPFEYQKTASIACMTSISEGWPLVLSEAMQCGAVPVVFNSFASASEIIRDGENGMLVSPFDLDEYAHKLQILMENEELLESMSKNAQNSIKAYDVGNISDRWEALFHSLLD